MKAIDLVNKKDIDFIDIGTKIIKSFKLDNWFTQPDLIFEDTVLRITNVDGTSRKDYIRLNVQNKNTTKQLYLHKDFEIKIPTKNAIEKYKKQHEKIMLRNLSFNLKFNYTIGSDPEIFVENNNGQIIPAFKFLGSKGKPSKASDSAYGNNNVYWDGFQAEFDTTAFKCLSHQVDSIRNGLLGVYTHAKKFDINAKLSYKTVFDIPEALMTNATDEHAAFGCMPSINAYTEKNIDLPNGRDVPFRSVGGHLHFGLGKLDKTKAIGMVKALDAILGVACVSLFANYDDPRRRALYGRAGEFRLPEHGLEYRVLSNAWLMHPVLTHVVFELARKVIAFNDLGLLKYWKYDEKEVINIINTCDVKAAQTLLRNNGGLFKELLGSLRNYCEYSIVSFLYNLFLNGPDKLFEHVTDIEKNWALNGNWLGHSENNNANIFKATREYILQGTKIG